MTLMLQCSLNIVDTLKFALFCNLPWQDVCLGYTQINSEFQENQQDESQ